MKYSLIVFDLDFTLWDAGGTWCDHTHPPYRHVNNHIMDSNDSQIVLYPEVRELLRDLSQLYTLAVASRTHQPDWAMELLKMFGISSYFKYFEIYPGSKSEHIRQIHKKSGISFQRMLFFDDEMRNVDEVSRMKVHSVLVDSGISRTRVFAHL